MHFAYHEQPHFFQRDTVRETRLCVTFYFVCCALLIHTFLASNNKTRERNLEGQRICERMIVGCKLVVCCDATQFYGSCSEYFCKNFFHLSSCAHMDVLLSVDI